MKPTTKIVLFLIIAVTAVVVSQIKPEARSATPSPQATYDSKENEGGNVTVSVTPLVLKSGFPASFDIAFETHSVDLAFDVEQIAEFSDGTDTTYVPHWEGSPPGGHHRSGTLRFTPDLPAGEAGRKKPSTITLTFKNIAGVPLRTFNWEGNGL